MRGYYIVSGILLILPIIDFAVAAPAFAQKKHQAGVDVVHISEDAITMLGERGDESDEVWLKFTSYLENYFGNPEKLSPTHPSSSSRPSAPADGWTDLNQPLPTIPEEPSPESSPESSPDRAMPNPGSLTETGYDLMEVDPSPGPAPGPSSPTIPSTDHELMAAHAPPNPGSPTESDYEMMEVSPPHGSASPIDSDNEMVDAQP